MESNQMQIFQKEEFGKVRILFIDDKPWFVAKDVGSALGLANVRTILASLYEEEKGVNNVYTLGGKQNVKIISESGLYHLLFVCDPRKGKARGVSEKEISEREGKLKRFRLWVTNEVLPSIRETGSYSVAGSETQALVDYIRTSTEYMSKMTDKLNQCDQRISDIETRLASVPVNPVTPVAPAIPVVSSPAIASFVPSVVKQDFVDTVTSKFDQKPCIKGMIFFLTGHNPKTISVRDQSVSIAFNYMYSQLVTVFGLNWKDRAPAQTKVDRLTPEDFVHCAEICYDAMLKKNLDPIEFINLMSA